MSSSKTFFQRAREAAVSVFRNPPQQQQQVIGTPLPQSTSFPGGYKVANARIVPIYKTFIGEFTPPTLRDAVTAYRTDGDIGNAVNFLTDAALAPGVYITGDTDYKDGDALALCEDFNRSILWGGNKFAERGLTSLLYQVTPELIYGGNTFLEMITPDTLYKLNQVQIATIWKINRDEFGNVQEIWQKVGGIPYQLDPKNIIHVPFITVNREPVGIGVLEQMLQPSMNMQGQIIPPLYVLKASLTYDLIRMVHRKGAPHTIFQFLDAGDEELQKYEQAIMNPDVDASWVTNLQASVATEVAGPSAGLKQVLDYLNARWQAALQTPINMLVTSSGYTEASARVAKELGGLLIEKIQLRLKDFVEHELYDRILTQNGFDPARARIELHYGLPEKPVFTLTEIGTLFDRNLIMPKEAREFLRQLGLELRDDTEFMEFLKNRGTAFAARGQSVAVNPQGGDPNPSIIDPLNVPQQAKAQMMEPGQVAPVNLSALAQQQAQKSGEPTAQVKAPAQATAQSKGVSESTLEAESLRIFSALDWNGRPKTNKVPVRFEQEHVVGKDRWTAGHQQKRGAK